jgi:hypothetical protein
MAFMQATAEIQWADHGSIGHTFRTNKYSPELVKRLMAENGVQEIVDQTSEEEDDEEDDEENDFFDEDDLAFIVE